MSFAPRNRVRVCLYQYDERPCHGTRPLRDVRQRDDNGENKGGAHQREKEETVVTPDKVTNMSRETKEVAQIRTTS